MIALFIARSGQCQTLAKRTAKRGWPVDVVLLSNRAEESRRDHGARLLAAAGVVSQHERRRAGSQLRRLAGAAGRRTGAGHGAAPWLQVDDEPGACARRAGAE